jgi:hypothetical protein
MIEIIKNFFSGLANYNKEVLPNYKVASGIVPASWYYNCRPWKGIVIHHSATVDGTQNDWEAIRRYHTSYRVDGEIVDEQTFKTMQMLGHGKVFEKPWTDIGYHGGWELEGSVYVFKIGRPWSMPGAHAGLHGNNAYNNDYLGLCVVGNYDKAAPTGFLWELCLKTVREIKQHFGFSVDRILGHREVYDKVGMPRQKTCPGSLFDMDKFRKEL